jgi:hypothetical protein
MLFDGLPEEDRLRIRDFVYSAPHELNLGLDRPGYHLMEQVERAQEYLRMAVTEHDRVIGARHGRSSS